MTQTVPSTIVSSTVASATVASSTVASSTFAADHDGSRYWLLVHDGQVSSIDWLDGERLLSLSTEVRLGQSKSQEFTFHPRGVAPGGKAVTLFVDRETPIELLSQSARAKRPRQSHWFG